MARAMIHDSWAYTLNQIPGYGVLPAITDKERFGCDLTTFNRWMSGVNGMPGCAPIVGKIAGHIASPVTEALVRWICQHGCFTAGTPVWVVETDEQGKEYIRSKPIEQIKPGDRVVSRNEATGKTTVRQVQNTTIRQIDRVLTLSLADAETGKSVETITTTREHPFYVKDKGFIPAGQLAIGNAIVTRAGPPLLVKGIHSQQRAEGYTVYNLTVGEDHTYFVGMTNGGIWVHNSEECTKIALRMLRKTRAGNVIRVESIIGRKGWLTPGNGYEEFSGKWYYHDVFVHDGRVYDPMMEQTKGAGAWVDHGRWCERWDMQWHVIRDWTGPDMAPYVRGQ